MPIQAIQVLSSRLRFVQRTITAKAAKGKSGISQVRLKKKLFMGFPRSYSFIESTSSTSTVLRLR